MLVLGILALIIIWTVLFVVSERESNGKNKVMTINSPAFADNQIIPDKYTCDGYDYNPPLVFNDVPAKAKSLVLIVDDPDAPNGDWVHWLVFNIPPTVTSIAEGSVPEKAIQGVSSSSRVGYEGPCPPSGTHRYFFKLYALDSLLELDETAVKLEVEKAMEGHILAQAQLVGLYKRH